MTNEALARKTAERVKNWHEYDIVKIILEALNEAIKGKDEALKEIQKCDNIAPAREIARIALLGLRPASQKPQQRTK